MNFPKALVSFGIFILTMGIAQAANPLKTTSYLGYNWQTGNNDLSRGIIYHVPDAAKFGPGPYPVFMWTPGTFQMHFDVMSLVILTQMSSRGFLAASVQYDNLNVMQFCATYTTRAKAVFEAARPTSAVSVLCALPGADCNKGVTTAGISQGGVLAILAKNYAPNVKAALAMTVSDYNKLGINLQCLDKQNTAIPADRLMIVNGQSDPIFGGQVPLQNVSGYSCPAGSFECWSPSGSGAGWYIVKDTQVSDGSAGHCYQMVGDCTGFLFDSTWLLSQTSVWSLKSNLDWLATLGTHRAIK